MFAVAKHMLPFTRYPYRGQVVACPVCEAKRFHGIATLDRRFKRLPTVMCEHCGLLYTNPMPDEAELSRYYEKYYRFDYQLATTKPTDKHRRKRHVEAAGRIANLEGLLPSGARTLDFGCGSGEFVEDMLERGHDAHGFEPGAAYGNDARARLGGRIRVARWQDVDFGPEFDLVTCFHVIEHLRDPLAAISAMASWIRPQGRIYIEVPDLGSEPFKGIGGFHFAHVVGFNTFNLQLAAARIGLRPVRIFAPTGILFERAAGEAVDVLAAKGLRLAREIHADRSALSRYAEYQMGKLRR